MRVNSISPQGYFKIYLSKHKWVINAEDRDICQKVLENILGGLRHWAAPAALLG